MTQGTLKKKLGLVDLTLLGVGSMIGSGWLYAALTSSGYAGGLTGWAWLLGAVMVLLIGLVFAELSAAIPRAGGFVRYPNYTHGNVVGFVIGVSSLLAYTSTAGVEVEAVRQYAMYWWPALGQSDGSPTRLGFVMQIVLLVCFFLLNYWSVSFFGRINTIITTFKFIVPLMVIVTLFGYFHGGNLSVPGTAPGGIHGIFSSLTGAGIVFAYLGFRQAVDFASEAKNPQRNIPIAIMLAIGISFVIYILLQFAFMGAVPTDILSAHGWVGLKTIFQSPYADLARSLGITWLINLILIDAVISPAGTGNIYLAGASRVLFAWAKNGHLFSIFAKVDPKSGVPRGALWLSLILAIAWTLPSEFQVWGGLIGAVTSATVFTYMPGPVNAGVMRSRLPDLPRPFRLPVFALLSPLAFVASTLLIYWSGWSVNELLIPILVIAWVAYVLFGKKDQHFKRDVRSAWWLLAYYVAIFILSYFGTYGGTGTISSPLDMVLVVVVTLVCYYWGVASGHEKLEIPPDMEEEDPHVSPRRETRVA
ncbi:APC family permease [Rahnella aquatilis]|uniref:APC family permease n=1 Tax=Rahnella perminowiae TaxID=2816244 RepID=UPI001C27E47D|nr:APC family permease [Rahnella perminowiae]MBU9827233.1 APC family permease [Rahnella perminowiae]MCR8999696.1 APC family permease [Rahnella perminowiae]UJD91159.1 APC family permease [Rahnella aquatilis]